MTLFSIGDESDDAQYLERTAERLRTMVAHTTGLHGADPVQVRTRLERMDRHVRRDTQEGRSFA
jgi:hypothetical protein